MSEKKSFNITKAYLEDLTFKDGIINFIYKIENLDNKKDIKEEILLLNRETGSKYIFDVVSIDEEYRKFKVSKEILDNIKIEKSNNIIDVFVRLRNKDKIKDIKLMIKEDYNSSINFSYYKLPSNNYYSYKPYRTGKDTLSIFIRLSKIEAIVEEINFSSRNIDILGKIQSKELDVWNITDREAYIVLKKRKKINDDYKYKYIDKVECYEDEIKIPIKLLNTYFKSKNEMLELILPKVKYKSKELLSKEKTTNQNTHAIWDMYLRTLDKDGKSLDITLKYKDKYERNIIIDNFNVKLFRNKFNGGLSYYIKDR